MDLLEILSKIILMTFITEKHKETEWEHCSESQNVQMLFLTFVIPEMFSEARGIDLEKEIS